RGAAALDARVLRRRTGRHGQRDNDNGSDHRSTLATAFFPLPLMATLQAPPHIGQNIDVVSPPSASNGNGASHDGQGTSRIVRRRMRVTAANTAAAPKMAPRPPIAAIGATNASI